VAVVLAVVVGVVYAAGLYLMMRRGVVKLIVGLSLLGHAANVLIFTAAGVARARPPIVAGGEGTLAAGAADPLPQAPILTAIVIGFGVQAFALVLILRGYRTTGTDNLDHLRTTDAP